MHGLKVPHTWKKVAMEQELWRTIEDVFQTIHHMIKTEEKTKAYSEPNSDLVPLMPTVSMHEVSLGKCAKPKPIVKTYHSNLNSNMQYSSNYRDDGIYHNSQYCKDQGKPKYGTHGPRKLECYYCQGEHLVRDCEKFNKDKVKYKLKTMDHAKKYKDKIRQAAKRGNIKVNKAIFSNAQESTYSLEQTEQLLGSLQFSDSISD